VICEVCGGVVAEPAPGSPYVNGAICARCEDQYARIARLILQEPELPTRPEPPRWPGVRPARPWENRRKAGRRKR
jgi:hypothetical protein